MHRGFAWLLVFYPPFFIKLFPFESERIEIHSNSVPEGVSDAGFPGADDNLGFLGFPGDGQEAPGQIMSSACSTATLMPPSRDHDSRAFVLDA